MGAWLPVRLQGLGCPVLEVTLQSQADFLHFFQVTLQLPVVGVLAEFVLDEAKAVVGGSEFDEDGFADVVVVHGRTFQMWPYEAVNALQRARKRSGDTLPSDQTGAPQPAAEGHVFSLLTAP